MEPQPPYVLLMKGRGIISKLISWQSYGDYSHAALLTRDNKIVEAWQGDGVREREPLTNWKDVTFFRYNGMTVEQANAVEGYMKARVGHGYDYWGVLRFLSRRKGRNNDDRWFCSELVHAAFMFAGIPLLNAPAERVHPSLLAYSPKLTQVTPNHRLPDREV